MNPQQNRLFDMTNSTGHDMEDLIETNADSEVKRLMRLIDVWDETLRDTAAEADEDAALDAAPPHAETTEYDETEVESYE